MPRSHRSSLLLLVLVSVLGAGPASAADPAETSLERLSHESFELPAPVQQEDRTVAVRAWWSGGAASAAAGERPVILFLHGWGDDETAWQRLGGVAAVDRLVGDGALPPVVAVTFDGGTSGYLDYRDGSERWERFIDRQLRPAIEQRYPATAGQPWAVLGTSMGGEAALRIGFRHPDRYRCLAAHSAALHPPRLDEVAEWARDGLAQDETAARQWGRPTDPEHWRTNNVLHLAASVDAEKLELLGIYFDAGVDDHLGFQAGAARLSALLAERGVPHLFALRPGGHGDAFTAPNLPHALHFLGECLAAGPP